jgi:hypothetical protein
MGGFCLDLQALMHSLPVEKEERGRRYEGDSSAGEYY